jgi:hypothetical protein
MATQVVTGLRHDAAIISQCPADEELHRHAVANIEDTYAFLFGRVIQKMSEMPQRS